MHISPINVLSQYNSALSIQNSQNGDFGLRLKPQLNQDVVTFGRYRRFLELTPAEIFARITKSISEKNMLGMGGEACVYSIERTKYCFRYPRIISGDFRSMIDLNVSDCDKVNHVVARLGAGATIMNRLKGVPVRSDSMSLEQINQISSAIAGFPVESYRAFLRQILDAHQKNMYFDNFWPNVIVNPKDKTITAIDFVEDLEIAGTFEPLSRMYESLTHEHTPPEHLRVIANKMLNAALKEVAPKQEPCIAPGDMYFELFVLDLRNSEKFQLKKSAFNDLRDVLTNIVKYKKAELAGEKTSTKLRKEIKIAKDMIDEMF